MTHSKKKGKKQSVCRPAVPVTFYWVSKEGIGTFTISNEVKGKVYLDNEYMTKAHTKRMLCKMIDSSILGEPPCGG